MSRGATDAGPVSFRRQVIAGVILGFDSLGHSVALTTLLFAGGLAVGGQLGLSIFLLAGLVGTFSLTMGRFFVGTVFSNAQMAPVAVLMPVIFIIQQADLTSDIKVLSALFLLGLTSVSAGALMILMSVFDLGRMVRVIPYSVTAGYLAASGALLVVSAMQLVCAGGACSADATLDQRGLPFMSVGFAALIWLAVRLSSNFGLVGCLLLGVVGVNATMAMSDDLAQTFYRFGLLAPASLAQEFFPDVTMIDSIPWALLVDNWSLVASAVLICVFGAMLNVAGIEMTLGRDVDTRSELARSGVTNIATGLLGSAPSYISSSKTLIATMIGGQGRLPALTACAVLLFGIAGSEAVLLGVPRFISSGLLIYFGLSIMADWLMTRRHQQSLPDQLLSIAIVVVSITLGMPEAIMLGVVTASLIFAAIYARLPVVRSVSDMSARRSTVDRGPVQTAFLDRHGHEVAVVELQGFLFFGSVTQLSRQMRDLLNRPARVTTVILDFHRVSRVDAAAIQALRRLQFMALGRDVRLILCAVNAQVGDDLLRGGLLPGDARITVQTSCDLALEMQEDALLERLEPAEADETALSALTQIINDPDAAQGLLDAMERQTVAQGTVLVAQGDVSGDVFILDQGNLSVYLRDETGHSHRIQKLRPGAIVGEIAAYTGTGRTADVVADREAVVYRLSETIIKSLSRTDADLAAYWHLAMAAALADKLRRTNKKMNERT